MVRKILPLLLVLLLTAPAGWSAPKKMSLKEIRSYKAQIVKLQKDVNRLKLKLKKAKAKQLRTDIYDKIDLENAKIAKLKNILYPKPKKKKAPITAVLRRPPTPVALPSLEASPEESLTREVIKVKRIGLNYDAGLYGGVFAGTGGMFLSGRVPLGLVMGPAVTAVRLSAGLTQTLSTDRRYAPVSLDLVFSFPPGFFSGVENYIGGGLNYAVRTTGGQAGTVGGELFYGIQSDGFGGVVFGELGFGVLRSGLVPAHSGLIVMVGFLEQFGL